MYILYIINSKVNVIDWLNIYFDLFTEFIYFENIDFMFRLYLLEMVKKTIVYFTLD